MKHWRMKLKKKNNNTKESKWEMRNLKSEDKNKNKK